MRIITSASYPLCNKQKQAIALLPTLSGKHRRCLFAQFKYRSDDINEYYKHKATSIKIIKNIHILSNNENYTFGQVFIDKHERAV